MDFSLVIRQRLQELGTEQRALAAAGQVTESYISQLLTGKKAPPAPGRSDIYDRMETFLRLPAGHLSTLADVERKNALKRKLADPPAPLFKEVRELLLQKCVTKKVQPVRAIFEKEPFGTLERLVTQKLLDVVKRVTRDEFKDEDWLGRVAQGGGRSPEQMRVIGLDFLDTDVFNLSTDNCVTFFDPLIESWDVDLATFGMEIVLNRRLAPGPPKKFEFVEQDATSPAGEEPGLQAFLQDPYLCGDATAEEIAFLRRLTFTEKRPTPLYYYRELQSLRDPLHFQRALTDHVPDDESSALKRGKRRTKGKDDDRPESELSLLAERRRRLLDQLDVVDKAMAALSGAGTPVAETRPAEPDVPVDPNASVALPKRVKPRRLMSDSHKEAVAVGKRRARTARDVADGLAREMPGDSFVPAIRTRDDNQPPRLVKRPTRK